MNIKYKKIEASFVELIDLLKECFSQSELDEVVDFIEHHEYGLAFDTSIDIIIDEDKKISNRAFQLIINLANMMEFNANVIGKKIILHVIQE